MVTEKKGNTLNVNLNKNANKKSTETLPEKVENNDVSKQLESRAKTNVPTIHEQCCSCGKWQEYKYPCAHAMVYLRNWMDLSFPRILQHHVHPW